MEELPGQAGDVGTARARMAATEILARWELERDHSPLDRVVAAEFRSRHYLNSRERRWVSEAVYGSIRLLLRQQQVLKALEIPATPEALIQLWSSEARLVADPDTLSAQNADAASFLEPGALLSARATLPDRAHPRDFLRSTLSFPEVLAEALETQLGPQAIPAALALNAQAPTTLRVNPLRAGRNQVLEALPDAVPTTYSPWGILLPHRVNIHDLPGYRAGWFEVQEEASQLMALLTDALPDQVVVDVGAGAGGKTLALAALMHNSGRLLALDTAAARLEALRRRAERAGARCIDVACPPVDAEGIWQPSEEPGRSLKAWLGQADCVLLDAPCTGSGVLRRSPDAKWRTVDRDAVTHLQKQLLAQSAQLVTSGGLLIYVTCAFERSQNESIIEYFLKTEIGSAFQVEPALPRLIAAVHRASSLAEFTLTRSRRKELREQDSRASSSGATAAQITERFQTLRAGAFLRTWPHRQGMDAFFAACLRRNA